MVNDQVSNELINFKTINTININDFFMFMKTNGTKKVSRNSLAWTLTVWVDEKSPISLLDNSNKYFQNYYGKLELIFHTFLDDGQLFHNSSIVPIEESLTARCVGRSSTGLSIHHTKAKNAPLLNLYKNHLSELTTELESSIFFNMTDNLRDDRLFEVSKKFSRNFQLSSTRYELITEALVKLSPECPCSGIDPGIYYYGEMLLVSRFYIDEYDENECFQSYKLYPTQNTKQVYLDKPPVLTLFSEQVQNGSNKLKDFLLKQYKINEPYFVKLEKSYRMLHSKPPYVIDVNISQIKTSVL